MLDPNLFGEPEDGPTPGSIEWYQVNDESGKEMEEPHVDWLRLWADACLIQEEAFFEGDVKGWFLAKEAILLYEQCLRDAA